VELIGSLAFSPLLFCRLAGSVSRIAFGLLFGLERGFTLGRLGSLTGRLFGCDTRGLGGRLFSQDALLFALAFLLLTQYLTLAMTLLTRSRDRFALLALLDQSGVVG
jgi:hypothetical protein